MSKIIQYIKESYSEMLEHVTWPTWAELQSGAVLVIVASIIISLVIFAMDEVAGNALKYLYESIA